MKEVDIGSWNGKNKEQIKKENPMIACDEYDWYFQSPNGETYDDVLSRCKKWIEKTQQIKQQHVIVMSHGLFGRVLRGALTNIKSEKAMRLAVPQSGFFILEAGESKFVTNDYEYV